MALTLDEAKNVLWSIVRTIDRKADLSVVPQTGGDPAVAATITLRKLQQQEAAVSYQQTVLKAWHEIDDALSAYNAERARNLQLAAKERDSRDALTLARARYDAGMTDFLVPLDAERTLLQARREHADSSARLALSLVAVSKALAASPPPTAPTIPMAGAG